MPSANVRLPLPLVRQHPWYPGQVGGVPGADAETGLRTHCTGTVFYVDPNYSGANTLRDGTNPTAPLSTITAALANCGDYQGDVVLVMQNDAWQYSPNASYTTAIVEDVTCTKHGVAIIGASPSGALGPVWQPATAAGTTLTVHGCDVLVEGFCFDGYVLGGAGGNGILAEWGAPPLWGDNFSVRHCFFSDTIDIAIQLEYAWNCYITNNVFQECDTAALYADPAGSAPSNCRIANNWFHDCALAISMTELEDSEIIGNRIYNSNAQGGGAATDEGIDTALGARNLIANNWFSCILPAGAPGDVDDFCSGSASDAWIGNFCSNGMLVTTPT